MGNTHAADLRRRHVADVTPASPITFAWSLLYHRMPGQLLATNIVSGRVLESDPGSTPTHPTAEPRTGQRHLRWLLHAVACAGPLVFLAVATVEGFLRDGYDPIAQPISALALGPRGWVQELNFALLAASFLSFAAVLRLAFRHGVAALSAPAALTVMTIGAVLAGVFPMDPPGAPASLAGNLHEVAGFLVFPWLPVVAFLVARRFRRDPAWRPYFTYTLATGLFCLASLVFFLVFVGTPSMPHALAGTRGVVQRIVLVPVFIWIAVVARPHSPGHRSISTAVTSSGRTPARDRSRATASSG